MAGVDILASAFSGANAAFLSEQYARWAADPASVDPTFAELFGALNEDARAVLEEFDRRLLGAAPSGVRGRGPRGRHPAAAGASAAVRRADPRRHHRLAARADADPLLPGARPSGGAARSARAADSQAARRARSALLWFHRQRPRQADLHRQRARPRNRDAARNPDHPARDLLRLDRRRVHAHPGPRPEVLDPAQGGRRALAQRVRCQGEAHHPAAAHRGGRLRGVLPEALRHHQALRPRGRRDHHSRAAHGDRDGGRARRGRGRHRHAASRPAQHAGQHRARSRSPRCSPSSAARASSPTMCRARAT